MEFQLNNVERLHTNGELSIHVSGNQEEAYSLLDFDRTHILTILTEFDQHKERGVVNKRVIANAALHSIADELWMIANDLAKVNPMDMNKMHEIRSRARGVMMTYAHNSKQTKAFSKVKAGTGER